MGPRDILFLSLLIFQSIGAKKVFLKVHKTFNIVSEYDQEIPQSQTADKPMAPRGRATAQPATQQWAVIGPTCFTQRPDMSCQQRTSSVCAARQLVSPIYPKKQWAAVFFISKFKWQPPDGGQQAEAIADIPSK